MDPGHQKPPTLSSRIRRDTAARAVDALLKWIRSQPQHQKAQLLEHDELIHLVVTMRKIPQKARINPYYIPLPHPLHSLSDASVCLFVDDRAKSPVQPSDAEARIRSESIPVSEVISLSSLKTDYIPYESRRKLCGSYDIFFADRRIIHLLPRLIGKQFFKKKKHPLPIDLSHKNWTTQLTKGCNSALLYTRTGTCCQLNVGRLSMGRDDIIDNIIAVVEGAVEKIPKGWANVRSILIKSDESVGLPIYQALPEMGLKIHVFPKGEGKVVDSEVDADAGHVSGNIIADQAAEEVTKVVSAKKSSSKKGKLHKVRYMDTNLDEVATMLDMLGDIKGDDNEHSLGIDDDGHLPQSNDPDFCGKKRKNAKKRKQTGKTAVESLKTSKLVEADELVGEKSHEKKNRKGKKKLKTSQVEDGFAGEELQSGIQKKTKNNVKKVSEIENSLENGVLVLEESKERKKSVGNKKQKSQKEEGPEVAEEEIFSKTTIASDVAKKMKGKTKKLESKQGSEKKNKKPKVHA